MLYLHVYRIYICVIIYREKVTYIGVHAESSKGSLVQLGRETLEDVLEHIIGLTATEELHGILNSGERRTLTELNNVLVGNHVTTGNQERSRLTLGDGIGRGNGGQEDEEVGQTHIEGVCEFDLIWRRLIVKDVDEDDRLEQKMKKISTLLYIPKDKGLVYRHFTLV